MGSKDAPKDIDINGGKLSRIVVDGVGVLVVELPNGDWFAKEHNVGWRLPTTAEAKQIEARAFNPVRDENGNALDIHGNKIED